MGASVCLHVFYSHFSCNEIWSVEVLLGFDSREISSYIFTPEKLPVERTYDVLGWTCPSSTVTVIQTL